MWGKIAVAVLTKMTFHRVEEFPPFLEEAGGGRGGGVAREVGSESWSLHVLGQPLCLGCVWLGSGVRGVVENGKNGTRCVRPWSQTGLWFSNLST